MDSAKSAFGMIVRKETPVTRVIDELIDTQLRRLAWLDNLTTREAADSPTSGRPHHHG